MTRISRYEIREEIGSGAMGQVFLAFDPIIERLVAIKTIDRDRLHSAELAETVGRFKREAMAAGRLTHPNIITVYEYGEDANICFIAMEHVAGQTLRAYLSNNPTPPIEAVQNISRQLFAAIVYAHEQGVLHRDLKPSNIVIVGNPADRATLQVKILDYGIAKVDSAVSLTQVGTVLGTPGYMAPEQYLGDSVDARADIYSLAVIVFEMLTGTRTFQGDMAQVLQQVVKNDAPLVSSLRLDLPEALDTVIAKALARKVDARYASMRDFREAFVAALANSQQSTYALVFHPQGAMDALPAASKTAIAADLPTLHSPASERPRQPAHSVPGNAHLSALASSINRMAAAASPQAGGKPSILFLDDEERILGALSALFRLKYEVLVSTDGAQALELVKTRQPNVVVSDQRMPNMLGIDFLRQARELDPSSVRILLTGYSDLAAIVGSINDGEVFRFINKPWSNQEIKNTIAEAVEISMSTKQAALAASVEVPATEIHRASEAILIAQKTRELFDLVNDGFGRTHPVCHAANIAAVLQTIEDQEVAILLCDLDSFDGASVMLKMLKQSHPQIQAVVMTGSSDSEGLIGLINEAQIFRFLNRPLRLGLLDRGLRSACAVYANLKLKPELLKRQKVEAKPETTQSSIGHQILQRLSFLIRPKSA